MKIKKEIPRAVKNFLMMGKTMPLFQYKVDGIYINMGPYTGTSLTKYYSEDPDSCLEYLDGVIENDNTPLKLKIITQQVQTDLINNYYKI